MANAVAISLALVATLTAAQTVNAAPIVENGAGETLVETVAGAKMLLEVMNVCADANYYLNVTDWAESFSGRYEVVQYVDNDGVEAGCAIPVPR